MNRVLETLDFQGKIDAPRARLDRLVPLRVEYVNLTAVGG